MLIVIVLGLLAFLVCYAATPFFRKYYIRKRWLDKPDQSRKLHKIDTPRSGGVGIALAYFSALGLVRLFWPGNVHLYVQHHVLLWAVLPATALVFAVGVWDDLKDLKPKQKLAGQCAAALLAVSLGVRLHLAHGPSWLGFVLSIVWLLACMNAINLIDGMDGLAAGVGLCVTLATLAVGLLTGNLGLAMATAPLAGALLAFLRYNFAPASVFLGDGGSLTIGFLLGCLGLIWDGHSGGSGMVGPVMALSLPLIDVGLALCRRHVRGVPLFGADRGHIHHRVQDLGLSTRRAAIVLYCFCLISASLGLLETFGGRGLGLGVMLLFLICAGVGIWQLRYVELSAAARTMHYGRLRRAWQDEVYLQEMRTALAAAKSIEDCWLVVRRTCDRLKIPTVQLQVGSASYMHSQSGHREAEFCTIRIQLSGGNSLVLSGSTAIANRTAATILHHLHLAVDEHLVLLREREAEMLLHEAA